MATTAITICNTALLFIGTDEITSFDDVNREAKLCNQIYETTLQSMLQKNPWRFSLTTRELSKLTTPPAEIDEFGFTNAFVIPAESLRIIRIDDPAENYIIVGDNVFSNNNEIKVEMQIRAQEAEFPSYFINALEYELAARLALAITDDAGKHQLFQNKADRELAIAKNIDGQEQPVLGPSETAFTITSVRT